MNTEEEAYFDTQLTFFVGWTKCHAQAGTIGPGQEARIPLHTFVFEDGKRFDPGTMKAKLLEVKARMGGYEVHRDLPAP